MLSACWFARQFPNWTGIFLYQSLFLLALVVAVLYFGVPTDKAVRLLARRAIAFLADLALFGLLTIGAANLLFLFPAVKPNALFSMMVAWGWFFAFVFFDWRVGGAPGELMLGLRLRKLEGGEAGLVTCLARNALTLLFPVLGLGKALSVLIQSKWVHFAQLAIVMALFSLLPFSIAFSGGHSLGDLLLGTAVLPRRSGKNQFPPGLTKGRWFGLAISSLLTGVIIASAMTFPYGSFVLERKPPPPGVSKIALSAEAEAQTAGALLTQVESDLSRAGVANPGEFLEDLRVSSAVGDVMPNCDEAKAPPVCQEPLKAGGTYPILRAQVRPTTPLLIQTLLLQSLTHTSSTYINRPAFLELEVVDKKSYGVFSLDYSEHYVFCMSGTREKPTDSLVGVSLSVFPYAGIDLLAVLMLGRLDFYSSVEKIPVWPD